MSHPEPDEPLYSGNAGHGSRPLDILDPQTSSASLSTHPAASLRDFTSPPPEKLTPPISPSPSLSAISSTTPLPGMAGHGTRGPQEGLDADHLRTKSVRDIVPAGEGGKKWEGREEGYIAKGERRGYGGFAGRDECLREEGEKKKGGGEEKTG